MSRLNVMAWLRAARLPSQSYIAFPLLLGQALYYAQSGTLSIPVLIFVQLFGLFDQLYIVLANDYADVETDRLNRTATVFSGGSRVLVQGQLEPHKLRRAARAAAGACVVCGLVLTFFGGWLSLPLTAAALALLWAYSFPPIKLSYRGGGELLQALGVGVVLPLFGYQAQAGGLAGFPWALLWVLVPPHLACAMATALPDEPSDRRSRKQTLVVLLGPRVVHGAIAALQMLGLVVLMLIDLPDTARDHVALVLMVPVLAAAAQPMLGETRPGTREMLVRVFVAILGTVSLVCGLCVALLWG